MQLLQLSGILFVIVCVCSGAQITNGKYFLKSHHDTYLGASRCDGYGQHSVSVHSAPHAKLCEQWSIERHGDKISLKTVHTLQKYLHSNSDGSVGLTKVRYEDALWTPLKHVDGTWSFQSTYGGLLSSDKNRSVYVVTEQIDAWENFSLERVDE